jgi:hypothetical protein
MALLDLADIAFKVVKSEHQLWSSSRRSDRRPNCAR